jgi:His/Glu/Gln/Arg/opine family amino acid ABC transporter permease subunit
MAELIQNYSWLLYISQGVFITLKYSIISVILGFIIGATILLMKLSNNRFISSFARIYISIIRGTPLLLQLSLVYYALPIILNINVSAFLAGIIAFSINSAAYIAEIIRAGYNSIDKKQLDAAQSLSIPKFYILKDIILPQTIQNSLPNLVNEVINLVKESSIIAIIGESDLMRRSQIVAAEQYSYFGPLLVAGICYYLIVLILGYFATKIERSINAKG